MSLLRGEFDEEILDTGNGIDNDSGRSDNGTC